MEQFLCHVCYYPRTSPKFPLRKELRMRDPPPRWPSGAILTRLNANLTQAGDALPFLYYAVPPITVGSFRDFIIDVFERGIPRESPRNRSRSR